MCGLQRVEGCTAKTDRSSLFSYVDLEARGAQSHPLRAIRSIVNEALAALASDYSALYSLGTAVDPAGEAAASDASGLLQAFYSIL